MHTPAALVRGQSWPIKHLYHYNHHNRFLQSSLDYRLASYIYVKMSRSYAIPNNLMLKDRLYIVYIIIGLHAWFRNRNQRISAANNTVAVRKLKKILIAFELSSLNFNSLVRAKWSFTIRYPNVVIKSLCGNLDICLNYHDNAYFKSWNSVCVISVTGRDRRWEMFKSCFSVTLLNSLTDFATEIHSVAEKQITWMHLI